MFDVTRGGAAVTRLEPSQAPLRLPPQPTTEAGIHAAWRGDLYVVLGDEQNGRRLGGAPLFQSAGAPHLARRASSCSSAAPSRSPTAACASARRAARAALPAAPAE